MFVRFRHISFLGLLFWAFSVLAQEQEVSVVLGKTKLMLGETYSITLIIKNSDKRLISKFPDIAGFKKLTSNSNSRVEKGVLTQTIVQNYQAEQEGVILIPAFTMTVNGKEFKSERTFVTIQVPETEKPTISYVEPKDNAFLELKTTKNKVFVGEGFTVQLAFLVPKDNRAEMEFDKLSEQVADILLKIKPKTCWEDNHYITELKPQETTQNGKKYTVYRLIETTFYPLNGGTIDIPNVSLNMIKYRVSNHGNQKQKAYKSYQAAGVNIKAVDLPEHPLKQKISVGKFRLEEKISKDSVQTGTNITYQIKVIGEGNISLVDIPEQKSDNQFDFYAPNVREKKYLSNSSLFGEKDFNYVFIPKKAGNYELSKYFNFVFFNTSKAQYDTLKSNRVLRVFGKDIESTQTEKTEEGVSIYDGIENLSTETKFWNQEKNIKWLINVILILMIVAAVFLFDFKK